MTLLTGLAEACATRKNSTADIMDEDTPAECMMSPDQDLQEVSVASCGAEHNDVAF